jgi:hypothetical protein
LYVCGTCDAGGGGTTTLQVSTMAPSSCEVAGSQRAQVPFAGCGGGCLCWFFRGSGGGSGGLLVASIALYGIATLSGCGACTDPGTKPGSYSIRVIGTSGSGAAANVVTMKVQVVVSVE